MRKLSILLLAVVSLRGSTYVVSLSGSDSSDGSAESPWRHIEYAMTRALQPGDVVLIEGGIYRPDPLPISDPCYSTPGGNTCIDDVLIRPSASGTLNNPITVTRLTGEEPVLSGRLVAASWTLYSGSVYYFSYSTPTSFPYDHPFQVTEDRKLMYLTSSLENVNQAGKAYVDQAATRVYAWVSGGVDPSAFLMEYAICRQAIDFSDKVSAIPKHWKLSNLTVRGYRSYAISITDGAGGIELDHVNVSYVGNSRPGGDLTSGHAVNVQYSNPASRIHGSSLHNNVAECLHISQTAVLGDVVEDNDIYDCGGPEWLRDNFPLSGGLPALIGQGIISRGSNVVIRNNRIRNNGYHGIVIESDFLGSEGVASPSNVTVEGNTIEGNAGNGVYLDGKNSQAPSNLNVVRNNVISLNNLRRAGNGDGEVRLRGNFDNLEVSNNKITSSSVNGILIQAMVGPASGAQGGADAVPENVSIFNNEIHYVGPTTSVTPISVSGGSFSRLDFDSLFVTSRASAVRWNSFLFFDLSLFTKVIGLEVNGRFCRKVQ